ncbi:hypothetical protein EAH73_18695 [Hymenobacter nivis]|uniref:Uncharacterized protein n=2 Tax=Hymenobacter nivis TaxID=1850093 RepID=A0A502GNS2_9BACT|nr:hypothetical protein EAH73_18695 [Hymenobacter nivis]
MRELPEYLAHFDTIADAGYAPSGTTTAPGQQSKTTSSTFFLYGYLIGEDADPLLCGHPDLRY